MVRIEETLLQLQKLATKPTLTKADHLQARQAMGALKGAGMSNEEISQLSRGKWALSTVKGYTTGLKAPLDNPWQSAVAALESLVTSGMSLDDVQTAVAVFDVLKSRGTSLGQVADLLVATESASVDVMVIVEHYDGMKKWGLSFNDLSEVLVLRKQLDEKGLGLDFVPQIAELAERYGSPERVLEAISSYGSLTEIRDEISRANAELEDLDRKKTSLQQKLETTRTDLSALSQPLQDYRRAVDLGFGGEELSAIAALSQKFGGVKAVIKALRAYGNCTEITVSIEKAALQLDRLKNDISKVEAQHGHLTTAISMCRTLMYDHNCGLDAISAVFSLAKKHGDPVTVLKTVEGYGTLEMTTKRIDELKGRLSENQKLVHQCEGQYNSVLKQLESLNALALRAGAEVEGVEARLLQSKNLARVVDLIKDPASANFNEFGPLVMVMAISIEKWVATHEQKFRSSYVIKSGLQALTKELGDK